MSQISKYQKFEPITINRREIKNATYNPRKIGDNEAKGLKKSIQKHGLVDTLIYNKRTGNLVGGHQRLSQLDILEKNSDYNLTVACIDVDLKQEKEINLILNNQSIQGEYDFDLVRDLLLEIGVENTGFTDYDLSMFGIEDDLREIETKSKTKEELQDAIDKVKEQKQLSKDKNIGRGENYIVVTFSTIEAKENFLDSLGHDGDDRYIKGEILDKKLKLSQ